MSEYMIETQNVTYAYSKGMPDEKVAVRDLTLTVEAGEFLGVIGHTGSGKSTFVQMLNGLLKPTSGSVRIGGQDIWQHKDKLRDVRFQVGLVFQYPEYQLFEETVYKDIAFGPRNMGLSDDVIRARVLEAADYAGIEKSDLERSPFDLSGGQKRRVAIAGVLAMQPAVLVLDEPTAGLDPAGREDILAEIARYHRERGATVLLVSHSMDDVARYANRVMVMNEGALFCCDTPQKVFQRAAELEEMGLGLPAATEIMLRLARAGCTVDTAAYTLEDAASSLLRTLQKGGGARA